MFVTPISATVFSKKIGDKKRLYVIDFAYDERVIWAQFISVIKPGFWVGNSMCLN